MSKSNLKLAVWICNAVIAVMSIFAIISYFFMPFWSIDIGYTVDGEMIDEMIGDIEDLDIDTKQIVGDGITIELSLAFDTGILFKSYGDEDEAIKALIEDNVDSLVDQLTDTLSTVAEKAVRTFASSIVAQEVHKSIKEILSEINSGVSDDEVTQRLNNLGITDEYISSKTNAIIDKVFSDGSTVDGVCDEIINTVDEIYAKIVSGNDADLKNSQFTDEQKDSIRDAVKDTIGTLAAEDGTIDADELIAGLFLNVMDSMMGSDSNSESDSNSGSSENYYSMATLESGSAIMQPLNGDGDQESATARLKGKVRDYIIDALPDDITPVLVWVMRGMTFMFFFSSFWWLFILIKLLVKVLKRNTPAVKNNPTVKLKAVIWLGWVPFFILVLLPSIALSVVSNVLGDEFAAIMSNASISFSSAGLIAAIFAWICIGVSIFYIVARKKFKSAGAFESAQAGGAENSLESMPEGGEESNVDGDSAVQPESMATPTDEAAASEDNTIFE